MKSQPRSAIIIGAGIGGLATAAILAKAGMKVTIYEALPTPGGRANIETVNGFVFDTGPSWFLMPEVFEHFYDLLGYSMNKVLYLKRLSPAYKVFFESGQKPVTIYGDEQKDMATFDGVEQGAGKQLHSYLNQAEKTYKLATQSFLYTNFSSPKAFLNKTVLKNGPRMIPYSLRPMHSYVAKFMRSPALQQILSYPTVFLGSSPYNTPALYHLMSYMDFRQGVFYPKGGMYKIIESIVAINEAFGVRMHCATPVASIKTNNGHADGITLQDGSFVAADIIISNADLHFTETRLLPAVAQTHPEASWAKRTPGPGAILLYLGVKGRLPMLGHHTLVFTKDWRKNFADIFKNKSMPHPASMYVCKPSATDPTVAPKGHENIFILVPVPALEGVSKQQIEELADEYLDQLIVQCGINDLRERIVYKKVVGPNNFAADLHSWHGSALGLSHTLKQSAIWRPSNKSKKLDNLYYVGGSTVPGIGLPMCLIGAELVYKRLSGDTSSAPLNKLTPLVREN